MTTKTIVCLANSTKHSGRCIAGIELIEDVAAHWIRPVSVRSGREVSEREREYQDGSDPQVLDIVAVPLSEALPEGFQTENWILDPQYYWEKRGSVTWEDLANLHQPGGSLWVIGASTYHGENDRVTLEEAESLNSSLRLIYITDLTLQVHTPGAAFNDPKRVVQARFTYAGVFYALRITDPRYKRAYLAQDNGFYDVGEAYLTVSLGEPWDGYAYKLVAAVIERDGGARG